MDKWIPPICLSFIYIYKNKKKNFEILKKKKYWLGHDALLKTEAWSMSWRRWSAKR